MAGGHTSSLAVYAVGILVGYWLYCILQSCEASPYSRTVVGQVHRFSANVSCQDETAPRDSSGASRDLWQLRPFWAQLVSLSDPFAIPALYPMRIGFPKSLHFYRGKMPYTKGGALPAVFTTQGEQQHKELKTPVASLYSLSNVISVEPFVDQVLGVLFKQLDERFVKNQATPDLAGWLQYFAFDVMGTTTFSKRYGLLETGSDIHGLIGAIWDFMLTIGPMTQFSDEAHLGTIESVYALEK